ncbi:MAG: hypothetical protein JNL70_12895 [Saprospiraceae bacterium]|nr:hypothetical protein [Saprospiraceae bacterium]
MSRIIYPLLLISFYTSLSFSQVKQPNALDSTTINVLDHRFIGGTAAFCKFVIENLRYPKEAVDNCRVGISSVTVKLRPAGAIDSIYFNNDVGLGMGIEEEITRCLLGTKGRWTRSLDHPVLTFTLSFQREGIEELPAFVNLSITNPILTQRTGCVTTKSLNAAFEKARKKKDYKHTLYLCEELLRRMPDSAAYKAERASLLKKLAE